ncbi:MAG: hypothetical protein IKK43_06200 [Clostridia bacterium]|nr:hypothetical protein [Clostridia bacterium]
MKSNKGISLVSLSVYVIVAAIVVGILTFMNANFFSKISDLTEKTEIINEHLKFVSVFLKDAKNSEKVVEYSATRIKFLNNVTYEIKVMEEKEEDYSNYAIYRDNVKICEGITNSAEGSAPAFDYDFLSNTVTFSLTFKNGDYEWIENGTYKIGRGY